MYAFSVHLIHPYSYPAVLVQNDVIQNEYVYTKGTIFTKDGDSVCNKQQV